MLILDTHVLVWLVEANSRLGKRARARVDDAWRAGELAVSAITFWEIATLRRKGRMEIHRNLVEWRAELLGSGLQEIAVSGDVAVAAGEHDELHGDPADRLIVATARSQRALLCTADEAILGALRKKERLNARE